LQEHFSIPAIYIHFQLLIFSLSTTNRTSTMLRPLLILRRLLHLVLGSGGTSDNLDELAGNNGLASAVEQNLELGDHLAGVLGGVVHGVAAGGLLAGVALSECPEEGVGKCVLAEAAKDGLVNLEGREVGWIEVLVLWQHRVIESLR
jgi:hypothetical protein